MSPIIGNLGSTPESPVLSYYKRPGEDSVPLLVIYRTQGPESNRERVKRMSMRACTAGCDVLVLILLTLEGGDAFNGYHVDFRSFGEVLGSKASLGSIAGLQELGFTVGLWSKYYDTSLSLCSEANIVLSTDNNFWNGFGGAFQTWAFSKTVSFATFQEEERFREWHHYAYTYDAASKTMAQFIDGAKVYEFSASSYAWIDTWASLEPLLNFGVSCHHHATAEPGAPRFCNDLRFLNAQIDDFSLFVGALSEAELGERWNSSLTDRISRDLEPRLALLYDFNDPLSTPGEVVNLGGAGAAFNLQIGRIDPTPDGDRFLSSKGDVVHFLPPSFIAAAPIPNKAAEPEWVPLVVYASAGCACVSTRVCMCTCACAHTYASAGCAASPRARGGGGGHGETWGVHMGWGVHKCAWGCAWVGCNGGSHGVHLNIAHHAMASYSRVWHGMASHTVV